MFLESNFRKVKTDDYTRDRMTDSKSKGYTKKTTRFEEDEMEISDKLMDDGSEWNIGVHLGFKGSLYEGGTIQV